MTHDEKWDRIAAIHARMRAIDAEWEKLNHDQQELLMLHIPLQKKRLTWQEAECRAKEIHELSEKGLTHRAIAEKMGIKRELVTHYCTSNCKAALRAGVQT